MDEADVSSRSCAVMDEMAIGAVRARAAADRRNGPAASVCACCGDPIPPERRIAQPGCVLCVECKSVTESRLF